jgi:hypothetical protein
MSALDASFQRHAVRTYALLVNLDCVAIDDLATPSEMSHGGLFERAATTKQVRFSV